MKLFLMTRIQKMKMKICNYLNGVARNWSKKRLQFFCILFLLLGMTISLEISLQAIKQTKPLDWFPRPHASVYVIPRSRPEVNLAWLRAMWSRIQIDQLYMDSLSLCDTTKYRAMLKSSSPFADSLRAIGILLSKNIK